MTCVATAPVYIDTGATPVDVKTINDVNAMSEDKKKEITVGVLSNPDNKKLIQQNIDNLCKQTQKSRKAFEDISILLASFDDRKFKTKKNTFIGPLRPNWETMRKVCRLEPFHESRGFHSDPIFSEVQRSAFKVQVRCQID